MSTALLDQPQTSISYDRAEMSEIVNRLVQVYDPLRIYLFGSYAWGTPNEDSDYDLCVVVEKSDTMRKWERGRKGRNVLLDIIRHQSLDIIVYTLHEFETAADHPSTLASPIKKRGILLYDKI